jgi:hypothetical protein
MRGMEESLLQRAPRWRQTGAALVDMAWLGGLWWLARSRGWVRDGGRAAQLLGLPGDPLREQLRSPGQLVLGTLTVDRRTGRRVTLWRTLAVIAAGAASQELTRRLRPADSAEREHAQETYFAEIQAIMRRHPQASPERDAELQAAGERHRMDAPSLARSIVPGLAVGMLTARLRRRLAPTVEVLARPRADHNP